MYKYVLFVLIWVSQLSAWSQSYYKVSVGANLRQAQVEAKLFPESNLIYMDEAYDGPEEWMIFMENLAVTDNEGQIIQTMKIGTDTLNLVDFKGGEINVSYTMNITHDSDEYTWYVGLNEAAYANDFGALWIGRALFILCDSNGPVEVTFDLHKNHDLVVPWRKTKNETTFSMPGNQQLFSSAIFIGKPEVSEIKLKSIETKLAFAFESSVEQQQFVSSKIREILNFYESAMGLTPDGQILIIGSLGKYLQGGVFGNSISMLLKSIPDETNSIQWGKYFAHEIFHQWNGSLLKAAENESEQLEWFQEGVTEYYSMKASLKTGLIKENDFLKYIGQHWSKYYLSPLELSIVQAGSDEFYSSAHTYSGGMIMAMVIDLEIQIGSNSQYTLDQVMSFLMKEAKTKSTPLTIARLKNAIKEVSKVDLDALFEENIVGKQKPDFEKYLKYCGLTLFKKETDVKALFEIQKLSQMSDPQRKFYEILTSK